MTFEDFRDFLQEIATTDELKFRVAIYNLGYNSQTLVPVTAPKRFNVTFHSKPAAEGSSSVL
jgi:hypothetical protein